MVKLIDVTGNAIRLPWILREMAALDWCKVIQLSCVEKLQISFWSSSGKKEEVDSLRKEEK